MADDVIDTNRDSSEASTGPGRRLAPYLAAAIAVVLGVLVVVLALNRGPTGDTADTPLLDNPAPAATGVLADGTPFDLSRRKGSWVVLNFFTHDCVPCIAEHPELIEFVEQQRALGSQGAEFYTVVQHSSREEVDEFFAERGGDWPVVYDDEFAFQTGFGVAQVPETWIIDPTGVVRGRIITTVEADDLSLTIQRYREAGL
jgi:cytochrome c biogenesis protein CcmG/thiol:disulfide interchange protein DsbE